MEKFLCIKDLLMHSGSIAFIKDKIYNATKGKDGLGDEVYCFEMNELNNINHNITQEYFSEYFIPVTTSTYERYIPFVDFENREIKLIDDQIEIFNKLIEISENRKSEIQEKCNHIYHFTSSGAYHDNFKCVHCGHETER